MDSLNILTNYSESDYIENIIEKASQSDAVIVCQSNTVGDEIRSKAKKMNLQIQEPIPIQWLKLYEREWIENQTPIILFKPLSIIQYLIDRNSGSLKTKDDKKEHKSGKYYISRKKQP